MTHICVSKLTIIGPNNGLSPGRRQAIIWTNGGILLIGPLGTNFIEILIGIQTFSFKKMHLKMSAKWRPFCLGLNVLTGYHPHDLSRNLFNGCNVMYVLRDQYDGCWWPGACLAPGHLQPPCRRRPTVTYQGPLNVMVPELLIHPSRLVHCHWDDRISVFRIHYSDVIMGAMASQITDASIVYSTIYLDADQRKHQSSASLAFVRGIRQWSVNSPLKGPVARKMFPLDDVIM